MRSSSRAHLCLLSRCEPELSPFDLVTLACHPESIFPAAEIRLINATAEGNNANGSPATQVAPVQGSARNELVEASKTFLESCVAEDQCLRLIQLLNEVKDWKESSVPIDERRQYSQVRAMLREAFSPRDVIRMHPWWLVLESEQRIAIRANQLAVWKMFDDGLRSGKSSLITQLTMGEGKTKVIIPMMVLEDLLGKQKSQNEDSVRVCCIVVMGSLLADCRQYYRNILSGGAFALPVCEIPFNRAIAANDSAVLATLRHTATYGLDKAIFLLAREHLLSFMQKKRELATCTQTLDVASRLKIFGANTTKYILDESDELLSHTFRLVYSIDASSEAPERDLRCEASQLLLGAIHTVATDATFLGAEYFTCENYGHHSDDSTVFASVRLKRDFASRQQTGVPLAQDMEAAHGSLREAIFKAVVEEQRKMREFYPSFWWLGRDSEEYRRGIVDPSSTEKMPEVGRMREAYLILRGLIGHGIAEFCLSRLLNVEYGDPSPERIAREGKRLAVPYDAANVPSPRNEFAHIDVQIMLTYLAAYHHGLTFPQFGEALTALINLESRSTMVLQYSLWHQSSRPCEPCHCAEIDLRNEAQKKAMYQRLKFNRHVAGFWVSECVLKGQLQVFPCCISSSSWDLAELKPLVGFSGTNENRWLMPLGVEFNYPRSNRLIKEVAPVDELGSLGECAMLVDNLLQMFQRTGNDCFDPELCCSSPEELLRCAATRHYRALIDVGALLAHCDIPALARKLCLESAFPLDGVHYWNVQLKRWETCQKNGFIDEKNELPQERCFVVFDDQHCRGTDRALPPDACAAVTLGHRLTKDRFLQAISRLRNLAFGQEAKLCCFSDIKSQIRGNTIHSVLRWLWENSATFNEQGLCEYARQGLYFFATKAHEASKQGEPLKKTVTSSVTDMYKDAIRQLTCQEAVRSDVALYREAHRMAGIPLFENGADQILGHMREFGEGIPILFETMDEKCERETEQEQEKEQETEVELHPSGPNDEAYNPQLHNFLRGPPPSCCVRLEESLHNLGVCISSNFVYATRNFLDVAKDAATNLSTATKSDVVLLRQAEHVLYCAPWALLLSPREAADCIKSGNKNIFPIAFEETVEIEDTAEEIVDVEDTNIMTTIMLWNGACLFPRALEAPLKAILEHCSPAAIEYFARRRCMRAKLLNSTLEKVSRELEDLAARHSAAQVAQTNQTAQAAQKAPAAQTAPVAQTAPAAQTAQAAQTQSTDGANSPQRQFRRVKRRAY